MAKFTGKINGSIVTMNQMKHCMRNLQLKFISNDYNDYKSRAIHGKTLFNNSLSKFTTVEKWCKHCLSMGIRTIEDFEHATHTCPQVQYMLHKVKDTLGINCDITPSICIYSCPRPPDARREALVEYTLIDKIWTIDTAQLNLNSSWECPHNRLEPIPPPPPPPPHHHHHRNF